MKTEPQKVFWHIRVKNCIRQFHPSYRELSKAEVKQVPDDYWQDDPVYSNKLISPRPSGEGM